MGGYLGGVRELIRCSGMSRRVTRGAFGAGHDITPPFTPPSLRGGFTSKYHVAFT